MCDLGAIKKAIEIRLDHGDALEELCQLIRQYENEVSMNLEALVYWFRAYMNAGQTEAAMECALLGKRFFPANGIIYYQLALAYEQKGEKLLAVEFYERAKMVCTVTHDEETLKRYAIAEKTAKLWDEVLKSLSQCEDGLDEIELMLEYQNSLNMASDALPYRVSQKVIGEYLFFGRFDKRYAALKERKPCFYEQNQQLGDLLHSQAEILEVEEGTGYLCSGEKEEYLLPVAVAEPDTVHQFSVDEKIFQILQRDSLHFNYYRIRRGTSICSSKTSYYGKPIPLGHSPKRKKLVLNIFVDGLSQEILNGNDFASHMPHTFRFFQGGTVCSHAYSSAEWTFPSLSSFVTGLDVIHHMMFHYNLCTELPDDVPTLAEYFAQRGYLTTKIDGEWRSIPPYGHLRGYQRYIYQNQYWGSKSESIINDVIEQIETFKETDHFIWMCLGDLHDIADGYDLPVAVQAKLPIDVRTAEARGITSVKQSASEHKIMQYKQMVSYTDMLLNRLYGYLEENFSEDEILVSLFGDHGQGYLVPEGEHFISRERVKIAFMFRGGEGSNSKMIVDEPISAVDYVPIMCRLAGITQGDAEIQGNLPECFGGKRREYVLSECFHPGDPYQVTFFADGYTVYFQNGVPTGEDGRFVLQNETIEAVDMDGKMIDDEELLDSFYHLAVQRISHLLIY